MGMPGRFDAPAWPAKVEARATMKLLNKTKRMFIIASKDMISGDARPEKTDSDKHLAYIGPDSIVEVVDGEGDRLMKLYPKELIRWGDEPKKSKKRKK